MLLFIVKIMKCIYSHSKCLIELAILAVASLKYLNAMVAKCRDALNVADLQRRRFNDMVLFGLIETRIIHEKKTVALKKNQGAELLKHESTLRGFFDDADDCFFVT